MAKLGELDSNLVELFIEKNVYEKYLKLKEECAKETPEVVP
jgi:hypothetical protein